ncbi:hypothetical protein [Bacillus sp. TH008]|uniref:hypothetical protein n=1 Tax=Bacillus sp. TH008 TaxID=1609979 RepID=UPI0006175620|nr:hypothetical protein [Bacillus sp. TH008]KKB71869.1 hypothetical protein TH62_19875 [Bacillus sp. TH008]
MAESKRESIGRTTLLNAGGQAHITDNATIYIDGSPKNAQIDGANGISVKIDVDVSEAITGLKAIQREAKAATKALAELREEQVEISVEEAARTLEKDLGNTKVDVSQLAEALRILTPSEVYRVSAQEAGESMRKLLDEINRGDC